MKILKIAEVQAKTSLCKASIYRAMSEGEFPKPVNLKGRAVGWYEHEIDEWLENRPRAQLQSAA